MQVQDKIIIALDVEELEQARRLVGMLQGHAGAFKIGKQLFTRCGPAVLQMIHGQGGRVFLDLKFHDIPTTVAKASCEAVRHNVFMFNMHALGGAAMMQQAVAEVSRLTREQHLPRPVMLAVTVLTSMGQQDLQSLGITLPLAELVIRLARSARDAGMDGVVASPQETAMIKKECGRQFLVVTPGIRPAAAQSHDQKRTMTPAQAVRSGSDYIVVGRPVTEAPDPLAALKTIIAELETA
jgi:orotidine-5'-phosphate decarboxylase